MEWIHVKDQLPIHKQQVLIFTGTVECATFLKGISEEERQLMKEGKLLDLQFEGWCSVSGTTYYKRSDVYRSEDVTGNNKLPYRWINSPMSWFGQNIKYWMPIPKFPDDLNEEGSII